MIKFTLVAYPGEDDEKRFSCGGDDGYAMHFSTEGYVEIYRDDLDHWHALETYNPDDYIIEINE